MPSGPDYASKIEKEYNFLPKFKNFLSFLIPEPVALGKPNSDFPWQWSIYKYIEGENLSAKNIENINDFARDLAKFLNEFQKIDTKDGLEAGEHNFY